MNARRACVVTACAFAVACVPASEKLPPAGAAGFVTEPSEATQGQPFPTRGGWTVQVERLVLQVFVSARSLEPRSLHYDVYLFDATKKAVALYASGIPVGAARVDFNLHARMPVPEGWEAYDDDVNALDVDEETQRRFDPPPPEGTTQQAGRNILLVASAERDGVIVRIDASFYGSGATEPTIDFESEEGVPVDVLANGLAYVPLPILVERLFGDVDSLVAADANGDGVVTTEELDAFAVDSVNAPRNRVDAMFGR